MYRRIIGVDPGKREPLQNALRLVAERGGRDIADLLAEIQGSDQRKVSS
jgi:hypothetical protein